MFYFFLVLIFNDNGFFLLNLPPLRTSQVTMKPHSSLSHISSPLPKRRVILPLPFSAKESIRRLKKDRFEIHPFLFVNRWGFCTEEAHFWNIFLNLFMWLFSSLRECAASVPWLAATVWHSKFRGRFRSGEFVEPWLLFCTHFGCAHLA